MPRVAILSFHSHGDRSFLDDRELAVLSGHLTQLGHENDLVEVRLEGPETEAELARVLQPFERVVFERVWSTEPIARLRAALPKHTFISCSGEHALDDAPADWCVTGALDHVLPPLLDYLEGRAPAPPVEARRRDGVAVPGAAPATAPAATQFRPNLTPLIVGPPRTRRTFSLKGNDGCPYQADAKDNPLYAGAAMPHRVGKGCAFCVTGQSYTSAPAQQTAQRVLEQLRAVRAAAPELQRLVLKDQNPFGWLPELLERAGAEGLGPFTLLLETRADWMLKSESRFERALERARAAKVTLAPFLVGIESFSQPELDRFNKGTTAEANERFIEQLWGWRERFGDAFTLDEASFGFILFTPWTAMSDLRANAAAIRRTRFDALRGSLLLSRARLYPDTALFYLAQRDGLLVQGYSRAGDDSAQRYGYFPAAPWRFVHADVAHLAALAQEASERTGSRDQLALLDRLLAAFEAAGPGFAKLTVDDVLVEDERRAPPPELVKRLEGLIAPLRLDQPLEGGWSFGPLSVSPGRLRIELRRASEPSVVLELMPRTGRDSFARSRHYDMHCAAKTEAERAAAAAVARAIAANDR